MGAVVVLVMGDSKLVVKHIIMEYLIKALHLKSYAQVVWNLIY